MTATETDWKLKYECARRKTQRLEDMITARGQKGAYEREIKRLHKLADDQFELRIECMGEFAKLRERYDKLLASISEADMVPEDERRWIRALYHDEGLTLEDIADKWEMGRVDVALIVFDAV